MKLFILFCFLSCVAFSAPSNQSSSQIKNKSSVEKSFTSRKTASENEGTQFVCNISSQTQVGVKENKLVLDRELQFPGIEEHQQITIFSNDGRQGMSVNSFFEDSAHPYIIDTISCEASMKCQATRTKYNKGKSSSQPLNISQGYDGVTFSLGNVAVFKYAASMGQFRVQNIQLEVEGYKAIGVVATCLAK